MKSQIAKNITEKNQNSTQDLLKLGNERLIQIEAEKKKISQCEKNDSLWNKIFKCGFCCPKEDEYHSMNWNLYIHCHKINKVNEHHHLWVRTVWLPFLFETIWYFLELLYTFLGLCQNLTPIRFSLSTGFHNQAKLWFLCTILPISQSSSNQNKSLRSVQGPNPIRKGKTR